MSTRQNNESKPQSKAATVAKIVWFEIPADDLNRAKAFYSKLFGWKIEKFPGPMEYWHIDTGGGDDVPDGGMLARKHQGQTITNYILVPSVDAAAAKVEKLGGKICMNKTAVPEMGYFVICTDPENNTFALWEKNESAE
jgi:predicted enzyme related to lactoylglutathione lyase